MPTFFAIGPDIQGLIDYMKYSRSDDFTLRLRTAWSELLLARLAEQRIVLPGRERLAVSRAVAFMRERLAQSIGVRDIARAAGTSSSRLHEAFVRQLGTTPHAYLVALRLDAAERMLADPACRLPRSPFGVAISTRARSAVLCGASATPRPQCSVAYFAAAREEMLKLRKSGPRRISASHASDPFRLRDFEDDRWDTA